VLDLQVDLQHRRGTESQGLYDQPEDGRCPARRDGL
jgi:hypothetical protein